jgi:uncharacterized membrane protein
VFSQLKRDAGPPSLVTKVRLHWYFQWFTVLFLGITLALGLAFRVYRKRTAAPAAVPEPAVQEAV